MKFKRFFVVCLAVLICLTSPAIAAQSRTITVDPINVMVGGEVFLPTDVNGNNVPVFVYNGTTYAPLRAVAEAYGLTVSYNAKRKLASISGTPSNDFAGTKGTAQALTKRTTLSVSSINIEVNGEVFLPKDANGKSVDIFVYNGTTYAPLRAVAEAYGLTVSYNQENRLACVDFVSTSGIDFDELLREVSTAREAQIKSPDSFEGYTDYLVNDSSTKNLLTADEVDLLLNSEDKEVHGVTGEQAVSDIDLLFRALHTGYGAYYYFGQDLFDQAEAKVRTWLEGQSTVTVDDLTDVLRKSLSFMVDAHSDVGYSLDRLEGVRYEYHYCTDQQFDKDDQGYFKLVNGQRVSFVSFSDEKATMAPSLLSNGKLVYSPVLFCPDNQVTATTIRLKQSNGTVYTESIAWIGTPEATSPSYPEYICIEENGLAYISVSSFQDYGEFKAYYEEFSRTGGQVKDCKAIIFDLRGNGGGSGGPMYRWIQNLTGTSPVLREAKADRQSVLNSTVASSVFDTPQINKGKWIDNDIPVIVLVDDACSSAGESALNLLKSMNNVLVVGSNSAGYQLGGNAVEFWLPYTGIRASIGTQLRFMFDVKNVDYVGYTPDVWCNPGDALDAAFNLLVNSGIADVEADRLFKEEVDSVTGIITLGFGQHTIHATDRFGSGGSSGTHTIRVYLNGELASDFTVSSANPSVCVVNKTDNGTFQVTSKGTGVTAITVRCGNSEDVFYWKS